MRAVLCALATALSAAQTSTLLFNQSESTATYDAVGVTLHGAASASATFAAGSWLNPPEFTEAFNASGAQLWTFQTGPGLYLVDTARHVEAGGGGGGAGAVDTFTAHLFFASPGATLFGHASSGSGAPAWNVSLPDCRSDSGGGTYNGLQAADDGSALTFLCHGATARAYLLDG